MEGSPPFSRRGGLHPTARPAAPLPAAGTVRPPRGPHAGPCTRPYCLVRVRAWPYVLSQAFAPALCLCECACACLHGFLRVARPTCTCVRVLSGASARPTSLRVRLLSRVSLARVPGPRACASPRGLLCGPRACTRPSVRLAPPTLPSPPLLCVSVAPAAGAAPSLPVFHTRRLCLVSGSRRFSGRVSTAAVCPPRAPRLARWLLRLPLAAASSRPGPAFPVGPSLPHARRLGLLSPRAPPCAPRPPKVPLLPAALHPSHPPLLRFSSPQAHPSPRPLSRLFFWGSVRTRILRPRAV